MVGRKQTGGFTIVELLIVIVVIAILAAISIVAFNGAQDRSRNSGRLAEVKQLIKLAELYKVQNGRLPSVTARAYCLGTNYPGGICRASSGANVVQANSVAEDTALLTELRTMGTFGDVLAAPVNAPTSGYSIGPFAIVYGTGAIQFYQVFSAKSMPSCPDGFTQSFLDATRLTCYQAVAP